MIPALLALTAAALVVVAFRCLYNWWDRQMDLDLDNWDPDTTDTPIFAATVADLGCIEVVAFAGLVERYVAGGES